MRNFFAIVKRMLRRHLVLPYMFADDLMALYGNRDVKLGVSEVIYIWGAMTAAEQRQQVSQAASIGAQLAAAGLGSMVRQCNDPDCETCKAARQAEADPDAAQVASAPVSQMDGPYL
jgi:hypothetical protein